MAGRDGQRIGECDGKLRDCRVQSASLSFIPQLLSLFCRVNKRNEERKTEKKEAVKVKSF
jgi:hypothetical protein